MITLKKIALLSSLIIPTTSIKCVLDEIIFGVVPTALATGFTGATYLTANALNLDEQTVKTVTGTALIASSFVVCQSILAFNRWNQEVSTRHDGTLGEALCGNVEEFINAMPAYSRPIFSCLKVWYFCKNLMDQPSIFFYTNNIKI